MSEADELFSDLLKKGVSEIERLRDEKIQETVELEFKRKTDSSTAKLDKSDKRYLGEALSGFSNSVGGCLIWGIDASKNEDGVDCVGQLHPIANIEAFKSTVTNLAGQYLMPKNDSVRVESVVGRDPATGFLLVRIPQSELRPHRSEAPGAKQYFGRSGDSFFAMEHYEIVDMINRRVNAQLAVSWNVITTSTVSSGAEFVHKCSVRICLKNISSVSAKYPYIGILDLHGSSVAPYGIDGNRSAGLNLTRNRGKYPLFFSGGADHIIHPGQELEVFGIKKNVERIRDGTVRYEGNVRPSPIFIDYDLGCEDQQLKSGTLHIDDAQLIEELPS